MAIGNQPPITNAAAAQKNKAAGQIHTQSMFKAGGKDLPTDASAIQKLGAAFTEEQGQADVQLAQSQAADVVADTGRAFEGSELERAEQNLQNQATVDQNIMEQKTRLVEMNIGINEDEFEDQQQIERLEQEQNFANETQVIDLARLKFEDDEEFKDVMQQVEQNIQQTQADDDWELTVYKQAMADSNLRAEILADVGLQAKIRAAEARAEKKKKDADAKAAKAGMVTGAIEATAGVGMMTASGGKIGSTQVIQGTTKVAQNT